MNGGFKMDYLMIKGFVEMERINGTIYVIVKRTDADLYRYRLLYPRVYRCHELSHSQLRRGNKYLALQRISQVYKYALL